MNSVRNDDIVTEGQARRGWDSTFCTFGEHESSQILDALRKFVEKDLNSKIPKGQDKAWKQSVGSLQKRIKEVREVKVQSHRYGVILEYQLPMELRRPDSVLLLDKSIAVLEFKGNPDPTAAAVDQVHAYARDLRCYHRECHERDVHPVLVNMRKEGKEVGEERGVRICGPEALDDLILELDGRSSGQSLDREKFLSETAYCPLPSLITAARELFRSRKTRRVWRASENTDKTVECLLQIVEDAKRTNGRRLALVTGVPGAGKTLAGLRLVHDESLEKGKDSDSAIPSLFLSGNGPLVSVLQYELKQAGGNGKTFVRDIKSYIQSRVKSRSSPNEHVIVYDEAQRAWDSEAVKERHNSTDPKTEPDLLVEFADRKDSWAVIVGLIGTGQNIQVGEEGGLKLWADAIGKSGKEWRVHAPEEHKADFMQTGKFCTEKNLYLGESIRSHLSGNLHEYVDLLLRLESEASELKEIAQNIKREGFDFWITRNEDKCIQYLRERYEDNRDARYGKIVSSRAKGMEKYGFDNSWNTLRDIKRNPGPWFGNNPDEEGSCCKLQSCATEFEIQGLEIDAAWLAWGTDFVLSEQGGWDCSRMQQYNAKNKLRVKNPDALRVNAYRVLLTRARDACLVYVPEVMEGGKDILKRTYNYLLESGMRPL